jgi:hypothetical protein
MSGRKGFSASSLVIGLLIFFVIIAGFVDFFSGMSDTYSYTNSTAINKYNNLTGIVGSIEGMGTLAGNSTSSTQSGFDSFLSAGTLWSVFKLFFGFGDFVNAIGGMVSSDFHLPFWLITAINAFVLITIVLTIISATIRRDI